MATILFTYIKKSNYIHNYPNNIFPNLDNKIKLKINLDLIDKLYETENYDECCLLINILISNKLSYNYLFIFKTLVLIDKINYIISDTEVESLLSVLEKNNFEEIFQISVVLIYNKMEHVAYKYFTNYLFENDILENEILKVILLIDKLNLLKDKINLNVDKNIVRHYLKHLDYIFNNIDKINEIDNTVQPDKIIVDILCFLNNRYELINDEEKQNKITSKVDSLIFNYNDIDNITDEVIFNKFLENPELVINTMDLLSDIMISEKDIIIKKKILVELQKLFWIDSI